MARVKKQENKNKGNDKEKIKRNITRLNIDHTLCHVTQSNNMFMYETNLSLNENKIVYGIIAQILSCDKEIPWYTINTANLCRLCGFDTHSISRIMKDISREICTKVFYIKRINLISEEGERTQQDVFVHWIDAFSYNDETKEWTIHINELMKPFLLNLKQNFTSETFSAFVKYRTLLGFRFHGVFTKEFDKRTCKFSAQQKLDYEMKVVCSLEQLKIWAQVTDKYPLYSNFKQRVLLPAIAEVNYLKYFHVKIDEIKDVGSRRICKVIFIVTLGENNSRYEKIMQKIQEKTREKHLLTGSSVAKKNKTVKEPSIADLEKLYMDGFKFTEKEWEDAQTLGTHLLMQALREAKSTFLEKNISRSEIKLVGKEILLEKVANLLKQQSTVVLDADEDDVENNPIWQNI